MEMVVYSAIFTVFIEVFEWDVLINTLSGYKFKQNELEEFAEFFVYALLTKRLFDCIINDMFYVQV